MSFIVSKEDFFLIRPKLKSISKLKSVNVQNKFKKYNSSGF